MLKFKGGVVMQDAKKIMAIVLVLPALLVIVVAALVAYFSG
jgi:hypothetical protein